MNIIVYLAVILKNSIYGASVFFTGSLSNNMDEFDILALRFLMSFVVLWVLKTLKVIKISVKMKELIGVSDRRKHIKNLMLTALFEPILYMIFETIGITHSTNVTTGVILSLSPIATCILQEIILKEKTTALKKIFIAIGIIGVAYIAVNTDTKNGQDSVLGILFLILAITTGSLFCIYSRKSSVEFNAMEVTYMGIFFGMLAFNSVNVVKHIIAGDILSYFTPYFNTENMVGFIYLAVVSAIIGNSLGNFALGKVPPATLTAFSGLSSMVTVILGVVFNNEVLYSYHVIGFTLILIRMIGITCLDCKKKK